MPQLRPPVQDSLLTCCGHRCSVNRSKLAVGWQVQPARTPLRRCKTSRQNVVPAPPASQPTHSHLPLYPPHQAFLPVPNLLPAAQASIKGHNNPLTDEALAAAKSADAVLLGAIGGPEWGPDLPVRPEEGLLRLRKELGTYGNLRPCSFASDSLVDSSPLRAEVCRGTDSRTCTDLDMRLDLIGLRSPGWVRKLRWRWY